MKHDFGKLRSFGKIGRYKVKMTWLAQDSFAWEIHAYGYVPTGDERCDCQFVMQFKRRHAKTTYYVYANGNCCIRYEAVWKGPLNDRNSCTPSENTIASAVAMMVEEGLPRWVATLSTWEEADPNHRCPVQQMDK